MFLILNFQKKFSEILSRRSGIAEEINLSPQEESEVIACLMDLTYDPITEYHAETQRVYVT
jgi:hypothetical protein